MKNRIRDLRLKAGITQKELGKKLELAESTISLYESEKREPDIATLLKIANFFDVTLDFLLCQTNDDTSLSQERSAAQIHDGGRYSDLTPEQIEKIKSYEAFLRAEAENEK